MRHYDKSGTMAAALDNDATRAFNELDAGQGRRSPSACSRC